MAEQDTNSGKLGVFISYSRSDLDFADHLDLALELAGFAPTLDRHGIHGAEDWKEKLGKLIRETDTVVFILSSDSAQSDICRWEVEQAVALGKRIIPVACRPLDGASPPPQLAALNYIYFYADPKKPGSGVRSGGEELIKALKVDLAWLQAHTRYLQRATEWDDGGRRPNRLLSGDDVDAAKTWAAERPRDAPALTALQLDYIKASEVEERARADALRRQLEEISTAQEGRARALAKAEAALKREQAAQSARTRGQRVIYSLLLSIIAGLVAFINQDFLKEQYTWHVVMQPTVLTAAEERDKAANPGPATTFAECKIDCPTMVVVPAGNFMMGTAGDQAGNEGPQHEVTIAKPFAVSRSEITFAEYNQCVAARACPSASAGGLGRVDRPVIEVSWESAKGYVAWLSKLTGKDYRLLSEAEWEYAARAGNPGTWSFGDDEAKLGEYAWYDDNSEWKIQPVMKKLPNSFGLFDMHGNVWEWTEDYWHGNYEGAPADAMAWTEGGDSSRRVVRGGSGDLYPALLRSAGRNSGATDHRRDNIGFRVGRTLSP